MRATATRPAGSHDPLDAKAAKELGNRHAGLELDLVEIH